MTDTSEGFVRRLKELLEEITGKPYSVVEKENLTKSVWSIVLDRQKLSLTERLSMNRGAYWVQEEKGGTRKFMAFL